MDNYTMDITIFKHLFEFIFNFVDNKQVFHYNKNIERTFRRVL